MTSISQRRIVHGLVLLVALLMIAGCGGDGGGGKSTGPSHVGTYVGTAETTLTHPQGTIPTKGGIQFVVAADNTVSVSDPGQPPFGTGTLSGDTFVVTAPGSTLNSSGVSCSGSIVFDGTISGAKMNGSISSNGLRCNNVPFSLSGTFTATLQAEMPAHLTGVVQALRDAVRSR